LEERVLAPLVRADYAAMGDVPTQGQWLEGFVDHQVIADVAAGQEGRGSRSPATRLGASRLNQIATFLATLPHEQGRSARSPTLMREEQPSGGRRCGVPAEVRAQLSLAAFFPWRMAESDFGSRYSAQSKQEHVMTLGNREGAFFQH
jgi:hypothetical protein